MGSLLGLVLITSIVFSTQIAPMRDVSATLTSSEWSTWANRAWNYFATNGVGWNSGTGLPYCGAGNHYFTDWDLATYLFAVLDAERLAIITRAQCTSRLDLIRTWLLNRQLTNGLSYLWYDSDTGSPQAGSPESNVPDYGGLLVAFFYWKTRRPEYGQAIYDVIARENSGIIRLASSQSYWDVAYGVYRWYAALGFRLFGYFDAYTPVKNAIAKLDQMMDNPGDQGTNVYGVRLPSEWITSEPLLLAALTLPSEIMNMTGIYGLAMKTYLAQENRYLGTGTWTAWSEGNTGQAAPDDYVYEWIVTPATTWKITRATGGDSTIPSPITYAKVAFGFQALYGTKYTKDLINTRLAPLFGDYSQGVPEGATEAGTLVNLKIDRTQMIILAAARYALNDERGTTRMTASIAPNPAFGGSPVTVSGMLYGTWKALKDGGLGGMLIKIKVYNITWSYSTTTVSQEGGVISKTLNAPSAAGTYTVMLTYDGDPNFEGCTASTSLTVYILIETTLTLTHRFESSGMGGARRFYGYLREKNTGNPVPGKTVRLTIYSGGYAYIFDITTNSQGYYDYLFTGNSGIFTWAEARFAGSGIYLASFSGRIYPS